MIKTLSVLGSCFILAIAAGPFTTSSCLASCTGNCRESDPSERPYSRPRT
jgi:hypothetical protein